MPPGDDIMLRLSLTRRVGPRAVVRLLEAFSSAQGLWEAGPEEWESLAGLPAGSWAESRGTDVARAADRVRQQCDRLGIALLSLVDPRYPEALSRIHDPPPVLYVRGEVPGPAELSRCVAIVGTRRPSSHGLAFTYRLAEALSSAGIPIASGLASGIDAEAHRATVAAAGRGIAVLPAGLDRIHPPVNASLAEMVARDGCLLSEFPPGTRVSRGMFVARNRLISGLARVVAVVEAGERSGALRTSEFALEQGRGVFVMPGRPGDPRVAGSLALLRDGADLLLDAGDVAREVGVALGKWSGGGLATLGNAASLLESGCATLDDLLLACDLSPAELMSRLGRLELEGRVRRSSDGLYCPGDVSAGVRTRPT